MSLILSKGHQALIVHTTLSRVMNERVPSIHGAELSVIYRKEVRVEVVAEAAALE